MNDISIVVPVYKEEGSISPFLNRILPVLEGLTDHFEIIFCLDPSPDNTESEILSAINSNDKLKLIVMSRRFGQPAATIAGISLCNGNACVVIDVDLQDPPEIISSLYKKLLEGYEVVYAKRRARDGETFLKKMIAYIGYALINKLSDIQIPRNTGDFRIMSRRVVDELKRLHESHGFLRGMVAYVGFKQSYVEYNRDMRYSGVGNYNRYFGSIKIGLNGLIGFSSKPLFLMSIMGFAISIFSFFLGIWYVAQKLMGFNLTPGLSTTVLLISFFAGSQLLGLGLIGEYVGRIYDEVKHRPMYIVDRLVNFRDQK